MFVFDEYQKQARSTVKYLERPENAIIYPTLGLCGEAGEVAEKIKKVFRDNARVVSDEKRKEIGKELGDVLWYVSALASDLGLSLDDIARWNLEKLASRQARGVVGGSGDNR